MLITQLKEQKIKEMISYHQQAKGEHSQAIRYLKQLLRAKGASQRANRKFEKFLFKEMDEYDES